MHIEYIVDCKCYRSKNYYIIYKQYIILLLINISNQIPQHAMPPEYGRKWGTECLTLSTLLCAGYCVKLIYLFFSIKSTLIVN